jgi:carbamoyl-phosphate synthase large subunit
MTVLLTSIGRRVALARAFQAELAAFSPGSRVLGVDVSALSAGFHAADEGFLVPKITDDDYLDRLLEIVHREGVKIIIPLLDTELPVLSQNRDLFLRAGCQVMVGDVEQILLTRDKARSVERFRELGFEAPRVYQEDELGDPEAFTYPLFLKPANGSSSIGATRINDADELRWHSARVESPVVQSFEEGEEFTIDVFADLQGIARCAVPRRRLETRAGEISKGITVKDPVMMDAASRLVTTLGGCRGCVTLQCFRRPDGRCVFFEANLRFGGGYPLSYAAGANYPAWILRMVAGESIPFFDDWEDGLVMLRFDDAIFVRGLSV